MGVELCRFEPGEEKAWDAFADQFPKAGHSHLSGWRRVIERSYGHLPLYLWACEAGKVNGVLPMVLIRSRLFGRSLVSLPFLDEGGICAEDARTSNELYQKALHLYDDYKANILDLRHRHPSDLLLPSNTSKVTLTLELASSPDEMWRRLDAKLRNQVRKAVKSGLTTSWNRLEGLPGFYDVFAANMRDLGSPVHSWRFFSAIMEEFPDSARLILVQKGGLTVGAGLCFLFRDTLLMPWASSRREHFSLCPNNLLYWEAIRWGCEKGYRRFDFGRSSPGSGTYRFKKQWGAGEEPLHWQCFRKGEGQSAMVHADDPRYRLIRKAWQYLPLTVVNWMGPILRKQMSN